MKRSVVLLSLGLAVFGLDAAESLPPPVMDWRFDRPISDYESSNHANALDLETVSEDGERVLRVSNVRSPRTPFTRPNGSVVMREVDTSFAVYSGKFRVTPGAPYAIKVRAKGTVRMQCPTPPPCVAWFGTDGQPLTTLDAEGKTVPFVSGFAFETDEKRWLTTLAHGVVPDGAAFGQLRLSCDQPNIEQGQWLAVSGVTYYERKEGCPWTFGDYAAPQVTRVSPSPCADLNAAVSVRVSDPSGVDLAGLVCTLDGRDVTRELIWRDDVFTYRPTTPWIRDSLHEFAVTSSDRVGNRGTSSCFVCFADSRIAHPRMTVRDDGMPLVDGRPFFPIAIDAVSACPVNGNDVDAGVRELKANGVNLVHTYAVRNARKRGGYEVLADACEKHGMLLRLEPAPREGEGRERRLWENVLEGRSRKCLYSWSIGDDTAMHRTPGELQRDDLLCRAIDDGVLTTQADICRSAGRYAPYAPYADGFAVEIYPVIEPTPQPEEMPTVVRDLNFAYGDLARSGAAPRNIEAIVQVFEGWTLWRRYPTREEIRSMAYLAIAARSRGILFYTYYSPNGQGAASTRARLDEFLGITRELAALHDDLASRDAAVQPTVRVKAGPRKDAFGQTSVVCLLKETGLMILASTAAEPVTVEVCVGKRCGTCVLPRNGVRVQNVNKVRK